MKLEITSYNIHKGKSFFTRQNKIEHIKDLILSCKSDFVFLQEVRNFHYRDFQKFQKFQLEFFEGEIFKLENISYGKNCCYVNGHHGNAFLSKYTILKTINFDISVSKLEKRGLLYNKVIFNNEIIHTFCTHLNLLSKDRHKQIKIIKNILKDLTVKTDKVILVGDFNDFRNEFDDEFKNEGFNYHGNVKTFPAILPIFSIDKIYVKNIELLKMEADKKINHILLSDHLPIKATLKI